MAFIDEGGATLLVAPPLVAMDGANAVALFSPKARNKEKDNFGRNILFDCTS
jgi:hypothetical protein